MHSNDQAADLRGLAEELGSGAAETPTAESRGRIIAVASGKGGVGKSSLVVNLAVALAAMGERITIVDADLGTADVDVMLGLHPIYNLAHVIEGSKTLNEVILEGRHNVRLLPGGSGIWELANLSARGREAATDVLTALAQDSDYVIVDTAAGISDNVIRFLLAADDVVVVTTPEPTAITDVYALVKVALSQQLRGPIRLVVNLATTAQAAEDVARNLAGVVERFLGGHLEFLGSLPTDPSVGRSVLRQEPVIVAYPSSPAARRIIALAQALRRETPALPRQAVSTPAPIPGEAKEGA
jgi:flagellar biosynthesis protein FlhG